MQITYNAQPTAAKLHASDKLVRGFLGPVGNGKSVACLQEGVRLSFEQWPNKDGIRKSRGVVIRNTGLDRDWETPGLAYLKRET